MCKCEKYELKWKIIGFDGVKNGWINDTNLNENEKRMFVATQSEIAAQNICALCPFHFFFCCPSNFTLSKELWNCCNSPCTGTILAVFPRLNRSFPLKSNYTEIWIMQFNVEFVQLEENVIFDVCLSYTSPYPCRILFTKFFAYEP